MSQRIQPSPTDQPPTDQLPMVSKVMAKTLEYKSLISHKLTSAALLNDNMVSHLHDLVDDVMLAMTT